MKEKLVSKHEKFDSSKFWIEHGIDLEKRRVMLDEEVESDSIGYIIRGIYKMIDMDETAPIDLIINCYGGDVYDCLALYDLLRSLDYLTVRTKVMGKCMSAGFYIFLAGDERTCGKNATFMQHSLSGGVEGKLFEMKVDTTEAQRIQDSFFAILSENSNKSKAWWKRQIKYEDKYFNKAQALELGIVTHE